MLRFVRNQRSATVANYLIYSQGSIQISAACREWDGVQVVEVELFSVRLGIVQGLGTRQARCLPGIAGANAPSLY